MFILNRRRFLELTAGTAAAAGFAVAASPAHAASGAEVFTGDPFGALVDSVVVAGEQKMLLIDAQFTVPNAARLADMLAATGKELETIFISHFHPDHHLGLAVLMDRFPNARPVAHASVQPGLAAAAQAMLDSMDGLIPADQLPDRVVIPDALPGEQLTLEGERFDILGPQHGDTDVITPVHLPQFDTLVASDVVFQNTHIWMAENITAERVDAWRGSLNALEAVGAGTIVPGHRTEGSRNDASALAFTRTYLDQWEAALADTSTREDLKAAMIERVGDLPAELFLDRAVGAVYG